MAERMAQGPNIIWQSERLEGRTFTQERVLSWTDIAWQSKWLEGRILHKKESFYGWILYG